MTKHLYETLESGSKVGQEVQRGCVLSHLFCLHMNTNLDINEGTAVVTELSADWSE